MPKERHTHKVRVHLLRLLGSWASRRVPGGGRPGNPSSLHNAAITCCPDRPLTTPMRTRLRSPLLDGSSETEGAGPEVSGWVRLPVRVLRRLCVLSPCIAMLISALLLLQLLISVLLLLQLLLSALLLLQLHTVWHGRVMRLFPSHLGHCQRVLCCDHDWRTLGCTRPPVPDRDARQDLR